jgi:hypothetical protein
MCPADGGAQAEVWKLRSRVKFMNMHPVTMDDTLM